MCGRMACTLDRDDLSCACEYKDVTGERQTLPWVKNALEYVPSCNMCPREVLPCIVGGIHFERKEDRLLCPMLWGMIPPWHKGDYKKHNLHSHNSRLDHVLNSKLYSIPLRKGRRCIIICDGYYEWKTEKTKQTSKQPYYIYANQKRNFKNDDTPVHSNDSFEETNWKGLKLLKMAGIFNEFKTEEGHIIHSCSVMTTTANDTISWLHDRAPIFLNSEDDVQIWLDSNVSANEAIDRLKTLTLIKGILSWHPVSTLVNNVSYKNDDCTKEIILKEKKKSSSASFMASWLQKGSALSAKNNGIATDNNSVKCEIHEDEVSPKKLKKN